MAVRFKMFSDNSDLDEGGDNVNTTAAGEKVLKLLKANRTKTDWNLMEQQLSDQDVKVIAQELKTNKTCQILGLEKNKITSNGVGYLAEVLKVNKTLKQIYLGVNRIDDRGAEQLCTVLTRYNNTVEEVMLSHNQITDRSVNTILELMDLKRTLKGVFLAGNQISEDNKKRLRKAAERGNVFLGENF